MTNYTYNPDDNPLNYRDNSGCLEAVSVATIFVILIAAIIALSACASIKTTTNEHYSDSVRVEYRHDTAFIRTTDTVYVEQSAQTEHTERSDIEFVDGGGSVVLDSLGNLLRIENIRNLRLNRTQTEQAQTIARQTSLIEAYKSENETLRRLLKSKTIMQDTERDTEAVTPKSSGWHRFLVWWFFITAGILFAFAAYKGWKIYLRIAVGI